MRFTPVGALPILLLAFFEGAGLAQNSDAEVFFETRIRPLLSENCFACHQDAQLGGLRLDSREAVLKGGNSGPAIVPGNPDQSLLILAVSHRHERLRMPLTGDKLKDHQIADLVTWVKIGAPWPDRKAAPVSKSKADTLTPEQKEFWAFQPCHEPAFPEVKNRTWPRSPIDYFILARLESRGLEPVRPADRRTRIRRASFDLTGLPPRPEDVRAFLKDSSPDAFARVIDRLLASPHYGERWGRYWLDVARYAEDDIRGLGQESYPHAYRYRDWVIQALNDDLPYDLFVKAQIAADLLDPKLREKLLPALGFFGLGPWYYDIAEPAQARADERNDRVDALTRGFLGLTVACARCHDHKYDPISMEDYYALAGVFASTQYQEYRLVAEKVVQEYEDLEQRIKEQESAIKEFTRTQSRELAEILAHQISSHLVAAWKVLNGPGTDPGAVASREQLDGETLERWVSYLREPAKEHPYLHSWKEVLEKYGTLEEVKETADEFQELVLSVMKEKKAIDAENRLILEVAKPKQGARMTRLPNGFLTYEDYCPGCNVSVKSIERDKFVLWKDLFEEFEPSEKKPKGGGILYYGGRQLDRFLSGEWKSHLESMRARLEALKKELPPKYPYLHGISESENPIDLRIHLRGSPHNLGEEVPRRFPAVLSEEKPLSFSQGSGRLELAEAIARHPLTARVLVNRVWQHHFGRGLVSTPSNFGFLGERPTHPQLLEYLTARFIQGGYSIKQLHRQIMLSATYQLSSDYSEENFRKDPDNRLLWRANRRRLDVEGLRDSLLFVAGNLDTATGGPSAEQSGDNRRRTIYGKISRFKLDDVLALFDFPDPSITSEQRNVTQVPLQRLFFLNSEFVIEQARGLARRLESEGAPDADKIRKAYWLAFGREPSETELQLGLQFLNPERKTIPGKDDKESADREDAALTAWDRYAQVLVSSNEFIYVD